MKNTSIISIILLTVLIGIVATYFILPRFMNNDQTPLIAQNGDNVFVHYTGKLQDGTVFDSSVTRGQPFNFVLGAGMVIKGWDEGILDMKVGDKKTLTIPSEKGYGALGVPDNKGGYIIPPNATLTFDVELIDIVRR
jgi:FKBP-type peptidyl-prolyl cis-trans isomerase